MVLQCRMQYFRRDWFYRIHFTIPWIVFYMAHTLVVFLIVPFLIFWLTHFTVSTVRLHTLHNLTIVIIFRVNFITLPFLFLGFIHSRVSTVSSHTLCVPITVIVPVRVENLSDCHAVDV